MDGAWSTLERIPEGLMKKFARDVPSAVTQEECSKLSSLAKDKVVLELGSQFGRSTIALASTAKMVHSVDWHDGDPYSGYEESISKFLENIKKHGVREKIVMHVGSFQDVLATFKEGMFDFCFIDAFHEEESVVQDANRVLPLMKTSGLVAFHDYGRPQFGVTKAVNAFADTRKAKIEIRGSLAMVKLYEEIDGDLL